jgi:uncharacterized membrane protein YqjE
LEIFHRIRSLMKELFIQLELHGRLLKLEWLQEKNRLHQMLGMGLLGFAFALCWLLSLGWFVIAASWSSEYRLISLLLVSMFYFSGLVVCWIRFNLLVARGAKSFASTREEFAADLAAIRSQL